MSAPGRHPRPAFARAPRSDERVEIRERKVVYDGFFRLEQYRLRHRLFSGEWSGEMLREVFERGDSACVLPYDPALDQVVLVQQFRAAALAAPHGAWLIELVAGIIGEGEDAEGVARRETVEEAGCEVAELIPICDYYPSPGGSSERVTLFCGRVDSGDVGGVHGLQGDGEDIRVQVMSFAEALDAIGKRLDSSPAIIALQWLALNRESVRRRWGVG